MRKTGKDGRTPGKADQVFVLKVFLEALEWGETVSAREIREMVGVVYGVSTGSLLRRHDGRP